MATSSLSVAIHQATAQVQQACAGLQFLSTHSSSPQQQQLIYSQVIVSLATLQSAVSDLSRAYINHANTVLNRGPVTVESSLSSGLAGGLATTLLENGLLGAGLPRHSSPPETTKPEVGDKKKRKRAPPDPNAPKRALTPYFLYMQHNRSQIASELGPQAKPKEVSDEGTKRWAEMPEDDKVVSLSLSLSSSLVVV
jgi:hypothetical protein